MPEQRPSTSPRDSSLYRAVWRWHFYAGLIVLPVLVWLAVTGGLYLYKPELDRLIYRDWIELGSRAEPMAVASLIQRVERMTGGRVTQIARPARADESWRMLVTATGGGRRTAFVDPGTGALLGTTREGGVMQIVRELHSLAITGPIGNALIEIAAGWAILLAASGFYLWWPRQGEPALALRRPLKERRFWRDLHASAGALAGAIILFLAVTGMPWSVFWGANVQALVAAQGLGRPKAPGPQPWEKAEHNHGDGQKNLPWALQAAAPPHAHGAGDIGIDLILAIAHRRGLVAPYILTLPAKSGAPYLVSRAAEKANESRALFVEPATGRILQDASYAQFGSGAQWIEWGIYTHQGQTYGEINRLVMLAGCLGLLLLAFTAPVLWWKRRRNGKLEPPPRPADRRKARGLLAVMLFFGLIYPLTGMTMLLALGGEWLISRYRAARA